MTDSYAQTMARNRNQFYAKLFASPEKCLRFPNNEGRVLEENAADSFLGQIKTKKNKTYLPNLCFLLIKTETLPYFHTSR